jgi:hypothetical protein
VPHDEIRTYDRDSLINVRRIYVRVTDTLKVTPHVYVDGYIGLKTYVLIGSKITPDGVTQIPIVTKREVTITENRIRQGESLVIGGIRKVEQRSVIRGVPFLKDVPFLGILFSSKDFEERAKEIIFVLTPTISSGGIPNKDVIADIQRKHAPIKQSDLIENIKDPLGAGAYTELVEAEAIHAEVGRVKAEMEKSAAKRKAEDLIIQIAVATKSLEDELKYGTRATETAETVAQTSITAVETSKTVTVQEQEKTQSANKLIETEKAKTAQSNELLKKATETAAAETAAAQKAIAEAAAAKAAAQKARADADEIIANWMKARQKEAEEKSIKIDDAP